MVQLLRMNELARSPIIIVAALVLPLEICGNTNAATIMIGERASSFILNN